MCWSDQTWMYMSVLFKTLAEIFLFIYLIISWYNSVVSNRNDVLEVLLLWLFHSLHTYTHMYSNTEIQVSWPTVVKGNLKVPFSIVNTPRCRRGHYSFPWIAPFTLDPYLIMLSVKQGGIKYHFLSLWYDLTWDWISVSWATGKCSNHYTKGPVTLKYIHTQISCGVIVRKLVLQTVVKWVTILRRCSILET